MRVLLALIACGVSCGHTPPRVVTGSGANPQPVNPPTSPPVAGSATEPLPELSALRLDIKQVVSPTEVVFELRLTNAGSVPIKITTNPRFGHRTFYGRREHEFEIQLIDARGRWVPFRCTDCRFSTYLPEEALLQSGKTRVFSFSIDHGCYDLVPGEKLSFIATYANLFVEGSLPSNGLPEVQPSDWVKVVVPGGWSSGGAAQQGVAADGASRRR